MDKTKHLPRLYVDAPLSAGGAVALSDGQSHYLRHVLRLSEGNHVRLFNGREGEWRAASAFHGKRDAAVVPDECLRAQPAVPVPTILAFAPLKKDAMDVLVQKAVELGATSLRPVLTQNTEARRVNLDRVRAQVIEAAEQCERLDVPDVLEPVGLEAMLAGWDAAVPLMAAVERMDAPGLAVTPGAPVAFLIGPEGGFTEAERGVLLKTPFVNPVSLGETILRAETAAIFCLSVRRAAGFSE